MFDRQIGSSIFCKNRVGWIFCSHLSHILHSFNGPIALVHTFLDRTTTAMQWRATKAFTPILGGLSTVRSLSFLLLPEKLCDILTPLLTNDPHALSLVESWCRVTMPAFREHREGIFQVTKECEEFALGMELDRRGQDGN